MRVSLNIYGDRAKLLAHELGLTYSHKTVDASMTAHFVYRNVAGHTVVAVEFTSTSKEN